MTHIFVNLKRFDVPRELGGLCPVSDSVQWIRSIVRDTAAAGDRQGWGLGIVYLLPESLVRPALDELSAMPPDARNRVIIGVQGVFREDVSPGGNFGAFTTNLPASAAKNLGAEWVIIGHSEERRDKMGVISAYDAGVNSGGPPFAKALEAVNTLVAAETTAALSAGLNVLLCMGETAEERGEGSFEEQQPRIQAALRGQIEVGLRDAKQKLNGRSLVVGYEPLWAIGPGKTPPDAEYIEFVSGFIKETADSMYGLIPDVVYGGGLKEENAAILAGVPSIDGGLVALTRFTEPLAFEPSDLKVIVDTYVSARGSKDAS